MAKVTAPLLGFNARGAIANTAVYARWRGIAYARQWVKPANPKTTQQNLTRNTFATLREIYKRLDANARAPWDAFAKGRPFTGMNSFVGENVRLLRGDPDMDDLLGSPGAGGGFPPAGISAAATATSGEVRVILTAPTLPAGWAIVRADVWAIREQLPDAVFPGVIAFGTDAASPYDMVLAGLGSNQPVQTVGWFVYTKPDGLLAYSVSLSAGATTAT